MAKLVSRIKEYARGGQVLFGDGATSGLFGGMRGGGVKGPLDEETDGPTDEDFISTSAY